MSKSKNVSFRTFNSIPFEPTSLVRTFRSIFARRGQSSSNKNKLRISESVLKKPSIFKVLLQSGSARFTSCSLSSCRLLVVSCCSSDRLAHSCVFAICCCTLLISGNFSITVTIRLLVSFMIPFANLMKESLF